MLRDEPMTRCPRRIERVAATLFVGVSLACNQLERLPAGEQMTGLPPAVDQALTRACATDAACHVAGGQPPLLAGASLGALEDGGYVRRGDLEGSVLAVKMLALPGIVGGVMPPPTHPADAADLSLILAWIAGLELEGGGATSVGSGSGGVETDDAATTGEPEPTDCLQGESLGTPPRFSELWPMLEVSCSFSSACHGPDTMQPPLMVDEMTAYDELVGATNAAGLTFVTPDSPDDSYLWHKLVGTHLEVGGDGFRMPVGVPLCDQGLVGVYAWILGGAQP